MYVISCFQGGSLLWRLKIEVDGQPVVDVANVMLEPTHFEHYWINVFDGVLTVGKGDPAPDKRIVPAHKILLALCCSKFLDICVSPAGAIHMPHVDYNILHAFLQYVYTGHAQVDENQLYDLKRLAEEFGLELNC
ncbi:unnamed protein product [Calypogeia fissa]